MSRNMRKLRHITSLYVNNSIVQKGYLTHEGFNNKMQKTNHKENYKAKWCAINPAKI